MSRELLGPSIPRRDGLLDLADEVVVVILRAIQEGWRVASARLGRDALPVSCEIRTTNRLRDGMRQAIDASRTRLRVLPGTEVIPCADAPRAVGLTDIPIIVRCLDGHEPHAIIECKRIRGDDPDLCRLYVVQGIDRFRHGKYGADHAQDFMVGYVFQSEIGGAVAGINRYLTGRRREAESLTDSNVLAASWVRQSCHVRKRKRKRPIRLHHAFLMTADGL